MRRRRTTTLAGSKNLADSCQGDNGCPKLTEQLVAPGMVGMLMRIDQEPHVASGDGS
jgi:hypothetical protein